MRDRPIQVLIVDDEASLRAPLAKWLEDHGYVVEATADGEEALELLRAKKCFDVVLLDYLLPSPYNGIALMGEIKRYCRERPMDFIIFTGWGLDAQVGVQALKAGAYRYLAKPFNPDELAILIQSIVETRQTMEKLERTSREKAWLESLLEVSQSVNSSLELDKVLQLILDEMKRVVVYDSASIQRLTDQGLEIIAFRGSSEPSRGTGYVFPPTDEYPNYRVWQSRQFLIVEDMRVTYKHSNVRGWLGVPLIRRGEAIGTITLDSRTPGFYDEDDARMATIFANQAAIAIENARLHEQTQKRADALHRLLEIGQQITGVADSPKRALESIARMACQVTGADCAVIYPYLAGKQAYDPANVASFGLHYNLTPSAKLREYGKSLAARIIREPDRLFIIPDVGQDTELGTKSKPLRESPFIRREAIQAFASIRLDFAAEPVGVLFVNFRSPHDFVQDELEIIQLFANQAAVAIWNARLYGHTTDRLEQKAAQLRTVREIDYLISSTLDLNQVLPLILDKALELLDVQNGSLQLVDDETNELVIQLHRGPALTSPQGLRLKLGDGITGAVAQEKRSIIVHDVTQAPWRGIYQKLWPGTHSELAVPLLIGHRCIGVLNLEHPQVGYFSDDARDIMEELAAQAAVAIQAAKYYQNWVETQQQLVAVEALAWMGMTSSSWAHSVAQKTSSLRNYLAVLGDYLPQDDNPRRILAKADQVATAIQDIPITRPLPAGASLETIDPLLIDRVLPDEVQKYAHSRPDVTLEFSLRCPGVKVRIDRSWLGVALEKLVNNALKAMPGRGRLRTISTRRDSHVEIDLIDTGPGIPEAYRPYFLKERVPKENLEEGTGMGAFMARMIFHKFGGDLQLLSSEPRRGTALRITLPIAEDAKERFQ